MAYQVISIMFAARDMAHKEHLKTQSFAQHMALGSFYEDIIGIADSLSEAYQGKHGIIKDIPSMAIKGNKNISQRLKVCVDMIRSCRILLMNLLLCFTLLSISLTTLNSVLPFSLYYGLNIIK